MEEFSESYLRQDVKQGGFLWRGLDVACNHLPCGHRGIGVGHSEVVTACAP